MKITLMSASELSREFVSSLPEGLRALLDSGAVTSRQVIALSAIRTCYSHLLPSEVAATEYEKYFGKPATDGKGGSEADRLFRHITGSGHTSTLEGITYTFAIEGVSRALLAQLTRHRHLSFSVQSQRYVRMGSADKIGGFDYVTPVKVGTQDVPGTDRYDGTRTPYRGDPLKAYEVFGEFMAEAQRTYDQLRAAGVPAEDARMVLPNAAACNLVMTGNLRTLLDFYAKRRPGRGAQHEIAGLAVRLRDEIVKVDPWLAPYFDTKESA